MKRELDLLTIATDLFAKIFPLIILVLFSTGCEDRITDESDNKPDDPFVSDTTMNVKVWVASPWQRVLRDTPPQQSDTVNLKSAKNEYEPFRIIVHNKTGYKMENVNILVSDLKDKNGNLIPANHITLYRAHYLHITKPSKKTNNPTGWYPDALIPFDIQTPGSKKTDALYIGAPFGVGNGGNTEVWCDLYVPPKTTPGLYKGTVTVIIDEKKLARIPVNLTVWDFELPEETSMRSRFGRLNPNATKMMGIEYNSERFKEMEKLQQAELLKHRVMPRTAFNVWPWWSEQQGKMVEGNASEHFKKIIEEEKYNAVELNMKGQNFVLDFWEEDPQRCKAYLSELGKWLEQLGYLDKVFILMKDEPNNAKEYETVRRQGALIREAHPGFRRMCTEQTITSNPEWGNLYGYVDIWCPLWGLWDEHTAEERLAKGEELWSYTALCQGDEGTPWWQIDMEPLNFRSPFWISWHYNITGMLYWSTTYWDECGTLQGVWEKGPRFIDQYWGDGTFLYPGQPVGIDGFVPSIRLKLCREAMEDYEYMVIAAKKGSKSSVDILINRLVQNFQEWSRVPDDYEEVREQLAKMIVGG